MSNPDFDRAAGLLFEAIAAEARFRSAGRDFLNAADGIDRGAIVARAAKCLWEKLVLDGSSCSLDEAQAAVWRDARRIFGWVNLAGLDTEGRA